MKQGRFNCDGVKPLELTAWNTEIKPRETKLIELDDPLVAPYQVLKHRSGFGNTFGRHAA